MWSNAHPALTFATIAIVGLAVPAGCRRVEAPPATSVVLAGVAKLPTDAADPAWNAAPQYVAKLIPQDLVDPRLMEPSTAELRVRAVSDGDQAAFRLQWTDETTDDFPIPGRFADACAVQLPATARPTVPLPQMGEAGQPVAITFWSASLQAIVDGRGDSLKDIYPNASIDHYPFQASSLKPGSAEQEAMAARYAPARALGNPMAGPRKTPVQDLIAEGPGTLGPAPSTDSDGRGGRTENGWAVVIRRPLPSGFAEQSHTQVAFAVWQGSHDEVGARKMRTGWITLTQEIGKTP
ncbi:MAG: hypothetical protein GXY83_43185 [Rhodopirellula sp.]|nr:hypothetical protein [Rhodopirellula sp.]